MLGRAKLGCLASSSGSSRLSLYFIGGLRRSSSVSSLDFMEEEATLSCPYSTVQPFTCSTFTEAQPVHILSDHSQVEWRQLVLQRTSSAEERLSDSECTVVYVVVHARQGAERVRLEVGGAQGRSSQVWTHGGLVSRIRSINKNGQVNVTQ